MVWRAVLLCVLVASLGVVSFGGSAPLRSVSHGVDDAAADALEPDSEWGPPLPALSGGNPWNESVLTVAIDDSGNESRAFAPLVHEALAYWENHAEQYAGYAVAYELVPNAENPDVVVRFVDEIGGCDVEANVVAGCAPYITPGSDVSRPVEVEVLTGFADASTVLVLRHELGHTLGLDHGDEPWDIMAGNDSLQTLPRPDATERTLPWDDPTLTVYVDDRNVSEPAAVREQVADAFAYYDRGADGTVPDNVTFAFTDNRSAADVVIDFPNEAPCTAGAGTCGARYGYDVDGDGELESYDRLEVALTDVDTDSVGWYVAYWLGYGLGYDAPADWPEPFRDVSDADRRGAWWATASAGQSPCPGFSRLPVAPELVTEIHRCNSIR